MQKKIIDPVDQVDNGNAESWQDDLPVDWNLVLDTGSVSQAAGRGESGYSVKIISSEPPGAPSYAYFRGAGTEGDMLEVSVWGKVDYNEDPPYEQCVIILNSATLAGATHYWTTGGGWQAMSSAGNLNPGEAQGSNDTPDTWTQVFAEVPVPANGEIGVYILILGPSAVGYIDDVSISTQGGVTDEDFIKFKIKNAVEELTALDKILPVYDKNGVLILYFDPFNKMWVFPE